MQTNYKTLKHAETDWVTHGVKITLFKQVIILNVLIIIHFVKIVLCSWHSMSMIVGGEVEQSLKIIIMNGGRSMSQLALLQYSDGTKSQNSFLSYLVVT